MDSSAQCLTHMAVTSWSTNLVLQWQPSMNAETVSGEDESMLGSAKWTVGMTPDKSSLEPPFRDAC